MTVATDGVVGLRPLTVDDLPIVQEWERRAPADQPFNFFGDAPPKKIGVPPVSGPAGDDVSRLLIVRADGLPIGDVSWRDVHYGPNPGSKAYQIGISLVPDQRGKGHGTRVQRLLADHLFATTDVFRIEASTDVDNVAEQRALTGAGFTREGVLRGAQFRAGDHHDLVLFSRLRTD